jgi:hypothetical protein
MAGQLPADRIEVLRSVGIDIVGECRARTKRSTPGA